MACCSSKLLFEYLSLIVCVLKIWSPKSYINGICRYGGGGGSSGRKLGSEKVMGVGPYKAISRIMKEEERPKMAHLTCCPLPCYAVVKSPPQCLARPCHAFRTELSNTSTPAPHFPTPTPPPFFTNYPLSAICCSSGTAKTHAFWQILLFT